MSIAIWFEVAHSICREMNIAPFYDKGPNHFDVVPCPAFQFDSNPAARNDGDPDLQHWCLFDLTFES